MGRLQRPLRACAAPPPGLRRSPPAGTSAANGHSAAARPATLPCRHNHALHHSTRGPAGEGFHAAPRTCPTFEGFLTSQLGREQYGWLAERVGRLPRRGGCTLLLPTADAVSGPLVRPGAPAEALDKLLGELVLTRHFSTVSAGRGARAWGQRGRLPPLSLPLPAPVPLPAGSRACAQPPTAAHPLPLHAGRGDGGGRLGHHAVWQPRGVLADRLQPPGGSVRGLGRHARVVRPLPLAFPGTGRSQVRRPTGVAWLA